MRSPAVPGVEEIGIDPVLKTGTVQPISEKCEPFPDSICIVNSLRKLDNVAYFTIHLK